MILRRSFVARARLGAALVSAALAASAQLLAQLPAFPGAEGFGAGATGGRGGTVYRVTNLNDSGAGSFRDAVSQPNRTVVFDVGGVIRITSRIAVRNNITIAGQTAPGEGITIYGNGVSFSGASNTICRFIRFRQGIQGDSGTDAVGIASGTDMIFDHVSASWGRDETFSISGSAIENITLQDCIVGQGLLVHSAGGLMQIDGGISVLRSLYVDNWMRNPKVKGRHEFTNNVVYNWGSGGAYICGDSAGQSYTNIINNLFVAGVDSGTTPAFIRGNLNFHTYAAGNLHDLVPDGALVTAPVHPNDSTIVDAQDAPYAYPSVATLLTPMQALAHVAQHAGASLHRDGVDDGMVSETLSFGTLGRQISNESEVGGVGTIAGGIAATDSDGDGMPDWWESAAGTDPAVADNNGDIDLDGYTNLENYLNAIAYAGIPGASITAVLDDTGAAAGDGNTADATIVLSGVAIPGSAVTVRRVGLGVIGATTADGAGAWTFDYSGTPLADGYYVFHASASTGGPESTLSRGFVVRVDTTAAAAPAINSMVVSPEVAFHGTSEPGVAVTIRLGGGEVVATTTADGLGAWVAPYTGPVLAPGVHAFTASAVDLAGNAGPDSAPYAVDTSLAAPTFTGIVSDTGLSAADQITNDPTLILNGTAPAGSTVAISRSGIVGVLAEVVADATGVWTLDTTGTTLPAGSYTFSATASLGGNSSPASTPFLVVVDTARPTIPSLVRHDPATAATAADTLVFRVTMNEPVTGVDTSDFSLTKSPASITGSIASVTEVSPSVYDVAVTGVSGDGTIRLDRPSSARITDYAGNTTNSAFTGGQSYTLRLPGSGVWSNALADGVWSEAANWEAGVVADGSGATADFGSLEISEDLTVHLDTPRTIGRVVFGDADVGTPALWTLDDGGNPANVLTLASSGVPTIQVNYAGTGTNPELAAASMATPAIIDVDLAGTQGLAKSGWGTARLVRTPSFTGPLTISQGNLQIGPGVVMTSPGVAIAVSSQLQVAGGEFTATGDVTMVSGTGVGVVVMDGVGTFQRIVPTNARNNLVKVTGGTMSATEINFPRSADGKNQWGTGLVIQGGTSTIGTVGLGTVNSWGNMSVEGGEVTITGPFHVGYQVTAGRGGQVRVLGGRLRVTDTDHGIIMSRTNGANANNVSELFVTGGVVDAGKITLGYDSTVTAGSATILVNGGSLYLGPGGLVKGGTDGLATFVTLESGLLGASASWDTMVPMTLSAITPDLVAIRTADESGVPRTVTLGGVLSGVGGLTKTGAGELVLQAANTYSGETVVAEGTLDLDGSVAGHITVQSGARIGGTGTIGGSLTLRTDAILASLPEAGPLVVQGSLLGDGSDRHSIDLPVSLAAATGDEFTLATFASTDTQASDFRISPMLPYRAVPIVDATSLRLRITGVGATAEYTHWAHLEGLPPGLDGPEDNPAGDGVPNLLKFVLALDPNTAAPQGIAPTTVQEGDTSYPAIVYIRRQALGGVTVDVLVSPDLGFATLLGAVEVSAVDNGDGTELVTVRSTVSTADQPHQFFRLAATLPAP